MVIAAFVPLSPLHLLSSSTLIFLIRFSKDCISPASPPYVPAAVCVTTLILGTVKPVTFKIS